MRTARDPMAKKIIYCDDCGKLIPPEEAEAEDYAAIGGPPVCPRCLIDTDPKRKARLDSVRTTRLNLSPAQVKSLKEAKPPVQTYPAPNHEIPESPTSTNIRMLREEVIAELKAERSQERAKKAEPSRAEATPDPNAQHKDQLSATAKRLLWAALGVASLLVVVLLLWPPRDAGTTPTAATEKPDSATEKPLTTPEDSAEKPREAPKRKVSNDGAKQAQLKEVETIVTLTGDSPKLDAALRAIERLNLIARAGRDPARSAAKDYLDHYCGVVDAHVRQKARDAARVARELANNRDYAGARSTLEGLIRNLPSKSRWAQRSGRAKIKMLLAELATKRSEDLQARRAAIEKLIQTNQLKSARAAARELQEHPDAEFKGVAADAIRKIDKAQTEMDVARRRTEEAALKAWPEFFKAFDTAISKGQLEQAAKLCSPAPDSPLRQGGMKNPTAVLGGFANAARSVEAMYAAALKKAESEKGKRLRLPRLVGQGPTYLKGARERDIVLSVTGDTEVKISILRLNVLELAALLKQPWPAPKSVHAPALWTLAFARGDWEKDGPARTMAEQYRQRDEPLPIHWAQRFALQQRGELKRQLKKHLDALRATLKAGRPSQIRTALSAFASLRPEDLTRLLEPEEQELVLKARRVAGSARVRHFVFQNGKLPTPEFDGIRTDQINRYYKNTHKTDIGVHQGIKLGSYNDIQRILIRFDGLQAVLGRGRVIKATLELYQTDAKSSVGADVGIFRLKRLWKPDAGTWTHADYRRKKPWQRPGATGSTDISDKPEAILRLDTEKGVWRSWDLTDYVREVLTEKVQNFGLLMRVVNREPFYDVRFYPNEDLEKGRDPNLRPRLVVEVETVGTDP